MEIFIYAIGVSLLMTFVLILAICAVLLGILRLISRSAYRSLMASVFPSYRMKMKWY